MNAESLELSPDQPEETVTEWEAHLRECGRLPIEGQDELRSLLSSRPSAEFKERLIRLLNPRGAKVVELSDAEFHESYWVTAEDNYGRICGEWDAMAVFDRAHGFYVHLLVVPLGRRKGDAIT